MPDVSPKFSRSLELYWPAALIGTVWLWMFWPMISGQTVCGFRDSAYLYYPLFKWIDSVWASGQIPLWNPYCNYGLPVVGDGSSSVFYPGKLIFLCRWLPYPSRYGIYLSSHVLLAAAGAYRLARTLKAKQAGATLSAISYAFGGSVLFQVTNVIYLVSAAWLPFALLFVWRGVLGGDWRASAMAGVVCALMILGGDPQMVYHVGLLAAASMVAFFWKRRRWLLKHSSASCHEAYGWLAKASSRLALMILVTTGLAAIQILPTAHWAARSARVNHFEIVSLPQAWEVANLAAQPTKRWATPVPPLNQIPDRLYRGLLQAPSHHNLSAKNATYQFSQPPWSLAELFFPNIMGKPFPVHQRWSDALPAAERIWTPSIYAGVLTVLLALTQFRLWGKRRRQVWLCRIGLFFAVASFGWFGLVWLLNEGLAVFGVSGFEIGGMRIGPQVGGLYWFMATVLPKYFMFRYPAKLFVIASLMISILAGLGLSQITNTNPKRKRVSRLPLVNPFASASGLHLIICVFCIGGLLTLQLATVELWLRRIRPNLLFGPLDVAGTVASLNASFAQPLILIGIFVVLTKTVRKRCRVESVSKYLAATVVLLTVFDVSIANRWLLAEVKSSVFEAPTEIGKQLDELKARYPDAIPRIYRSFDVQAREQTWPYQASANRLEEIVAWQRETLFPKHHLEQNIALLGSFSSIMPVEYATNNYFLLREKRLINLEQGSLTGQFVNDKDTGEFQLECSPVQIRQASLEIAKCSIWHEQPNSLGFRYEKHFVHTKSDTVSTRRTTNNQLVIDVNVPNPAFGLETIATLRLENILSDEGWKIVVKDADSQAIVPVEATRRGYRTTFLLDPGSYRITFTYSPREFWIGCWVSGLSWLLLGATLLSSRRKDFSWAKL